MSAGQNTVGGVLAKVVLAVFLGIFLSSPALGQYGGAGMGMGTPGMPGYIAPKNGYGSGKTVGIGVGAGVAVGMLFVALHHHGEVKGCVRQTDGGLQLVDEKKHKSYSLERGSVDVKAGDFVQLKGKKSSGTSGAEMFEPTKVIKNFGSCVADAAY